MKPKCRDCGTTYTNVHAVKYPGYCCVMCAEHMAKKHGWYRKKAWERPTVEDVLIKAGRLGHQYPEE